MSHLRRAVGGLNRSGDQNRRQRRSQTMGHAIFRFDASPKIGAGHAMRCIALAEACADMGWNVSFVVDRQTKSVVPAMERFGLAVHAFSDRESELKTIQEVADGVADLLVIDHYERGEDFEKSCRKYAKKILVLDDGASRSHDCDILVDAAATDPGRYKKYIPEHARVLSGPEVAIVQKSFVARRFTSSSRRAEHQVRTIFVSCGATDPANATPLVLDALNGLNPDVSVTIAMSSRAPHLDAVKSRLGDNMQLKLDCDDMPGLMAEADLAIGAPGGTAWERCCLGLPSIVITLADNQRGIASTLLAAGAAIDAGRIEAGFVDRLRGLVVDLLADQERRMAIGEAARKLVDGRGTQRILLELADPVRDRKGGLVRLRLASRSDESWLLGLQAQPKSRQFARNKAVPGASEHHEWFTQTLESPEKRLYIVEVDALPAGMVRLDEIPDIEHIKRFEISIVIDEAFQRRGVASAALSVILGMTGRAVIDAFIFPENTASIAAFTNSGFTLASECVYRFHPSRLSR